MYDDPLLRFRPHFPTAEASPYLISNSLGAMPVEAAQDLQAYAEIWTTRGVRAWADAWWTLPGQVGDLLGQLFGAPAGTVSMHQNVSLVQAAIISCFDWSGPRNKVVYTDMNFPSVMYVYQRLARSLGSMSPKRPTALWLSTRAKKASRASTTAPKREAVESEGVRPWRLPE